MINYERGGTDLGLLDRRRRLLEVLVEENRRLRLVRGALLQLVELRVAKLERILAHLGVLVLERGLHRRLDLGLHARVVAAHVAQQLARELLAGKRHNLWRGRSGQRGFGDREPAGGAGGAGGERRWRVW